MKTDQMIYYWAHMLDESSHALYYEVYMQQHPEDKLPKLVDTLVGQFAKDLKKDHLDFENCVKNGKVDVTCIDNMQKSIKTKYHWDLIKAQTYAAIISRMTALLYRSKGQRFNEDEISFDDISHAVSRRTIESCLDIICHNTNVLEANNALMLDAYDGSPIYGECFAKHGIPTLPRRDHWHDKDVDDYFYATQVYKAWAAYAKGNAGEAYVCDSDNGPAELRKRLNEVEYSADDIDLAVALNKCLDVVHFRSDLAAAFIEGGQKTCALVSNLPDKFVI